MLIKYLPQIEKQLRVILASASPRRLEILQGVGLKFEVIPSTFDEDLDKSAFPNPGAYAAETATHKAIEVARRSIKDGDARKILVIGADTVVHLHDKVLEKPADDQDAFTILRSLSGKTHYVYTGVALVIPSATDPKVDAPPLVHSFAERTEVRFAELDDETIWAYVRSREPMDKAGAYGIQGIGGSFVQAVNGCYFNVMGLPLHRLASEIVMLLPQLGLASA